MAAAVATATLLASTSTANAAWLAAVAASTASAMAALLRRRGAVTAPPSTDRQEQHDQRVNLAETAHELRTPLTSVITALDLLREDMDLAPADRDMFLQQAAVAARHMAFLINDLVDAAALAAGKLSLHLRPHHVRDVAVDVDQVMGLTAQSRDIELAVMVPPEGIVVQGDRSRILQVLFNLVGNAIKYSAPGSTVLLLVSTAAPWCQFEVIDEGSGIPAELRDRLFGRFARGADPERSRTHSSGLGLYVCRRLVELMQGGIGFRPRPDGGSVFWFCLPLATSETVEAGAASCATTGDAP